MTINCTLCAGQMYDPNTVLPSDGSGNITTCGDVAANISAFNNDPIACHATLSLIEPFCCGSGNSASVCTLCGPNKTMAYPDNVVPGSNLTCSALNLGLAFRPMDQCPMAIQSFMTDLDLQAFCGCPGVPYPDACKFCNISQTPYPDLLIQGYTCRSFAELARSIRNVTLCNDYVALFNDGCCPTGKTLPCSICSGGASMGNPSRPLYGQSTTCVELNFMFGFLTASQCQRSSDIDLASWCDCPGTSPPDLCSLCPSGSNLTNASMIVPSLPSLTCDQVQQVARYVTNKTICSSEVAMAEGYCCLAVPTPAPHHSTTIGTPTTTTTTGSTVSPGQAPAASGTTTSASTHHNHRNSPLGIWWMIGLTVLIFYGDLGLD